MEETAREDSERDRAIGGLIINHKKKKFKNKKQAESKSAKTTPKNDGYFRMLLFFVELFSGFSFGFACKAGDGAGSGDDDGAGAGAGDEAGTGAVGPTCCLACVRSRVVIADAVCQHLFLGPFIDGRCSPCPLDTRQNKYLLQIRTPNLYIFYAISRLDFVKN